MTTEESHAHSPSATMRLVLGTLAAVLAAILLALPAIWYIGWAERGAEPRHEVVSGLLALAALDAAWEQEAARPGAVPAPSAAADPAARAAPILERLQADARGVESPALQRGLAELAPAFAEKADLVARLRSAQSVSHAALREALAMEPVLAGLLREAWRETPDRQRLIAADNVATQVFADIQRYYYAPADSTRKQLEASAGDLTVAATMLPEALAPAVTRLTAHVAELVRTRPAEQLYFDRVRFHPAAPRLATLIREFRNELARERATRERYRVYLAAYGGVLLVALAWLAASLIQSRATRKSV